MDPASDRLDARLREGALGNGPIRALARWLADVHARARPEPGPGPGGVAQRLEERLARLTGRVPEDDLPALRQVATAQRDFLARHADRLRDRERAGRVRAFDAAPPRLAELRLVEASGDADAGTAARGDEEGRVLREPVGPEPGARDGCADVAGLALELACGGRGDLAERLLSAYACCADDFDLYAVADFHERDRALALAEAALEREATDAASAAHRLLRAAVATRRRPLLPPVVVAVGGQVARGKSTVSRALAERIGAPRVEADRVRDALLERSARGAEVAGADAAGYEAHESRETRETHETHETDWERAFAPDFGEAVYAELLRCASAVLASGRAVVIDACFPREAQRARARELARRAGHPFLFVECRAERSTVDARLAEREGSGWHELAGRLAERWEPVAGLAPGEHVVLRTDGAPDLAPLEGRLPAWPEGLPE